MTDVAPRKTGLLMVDFQRFYCDPANRKRNSFASGNEWTEKTAQDAASLVPHFKAAGARVYSVYYKHFFLLENGLETFQVNPDLADKSLIKFSNDIFDSFCKDFKTGERQRFKDVLTKDGITDLLICGVNLDFCVRLAAESARAAGFKVTVISNMSAIGGNPTDQSSLKDIFQAFRDKKIAVQSSATVLRRLQKPDLK